MSVVCALLERESDPAKAADAIASQDYVLTIGARERGYTIYDRYVDAGISGEVRDRPALLRLFESEHELAIRYRITLCCHCVVSRTQG